MLSKLAPPTARPLSATRQFLAAALTSSRRSLSSRGLQSVLKKPEFKLAAALKVPQVEPTASAQPSPSTAPSSSCSTPSPSSFTSTRASTLLAAPAASTSRIKNKFAGLSLDRRPPDDLRAVGQLRELQRSSKMEFTRLPNGTRIVSCDRGGAGAQFGLAVKIGSRFEKEHEQGCTHLLEMLALRETAHFTNFGMAKLLEQIGAHFSIAGGTRETLLYRVEALRDCLPLVVPLLTSNFLAPKFLPEEVGDAIAKIEESKQLHFLDQHPESAVNELLHQVAYGDSPNSLGSPLLPKNVKRAEQHLQPYWERFARDGQKLLYCAVNVDHEDFVKEVQEAVGGAEEAVEGAVEEGGNHEQSAAATGGAGSSPAADCSSVAAAPPGAPAAPPGAAATAGPAHDLLKHPEAPLTTYSGGFLATPSPLGPEQCPLSHIAIAFQLPGGWNGEEVLAASVLQTLLGGGGSFSTGGPGKGMHSRLFTQVLNRYAWVEQCSAFSHQYSDTGLFGIYGIVDPNHARDFVTITANTFFDLRSFSPIEVERAKNQLKSSIYMNLEPNAVMLEDFARQLLMSGVVATGKDFAGMVDKVTAEDLTDVGRKLLESKPSVVHYGNIGAEALADYGEIEKLFGRVRAGMGEGGLGAVAGRK